MKQLFFVIFLVFTFYSCKQQTEFNDVVQTQDTVAPPFVDQKLENDTDDNDINNNSYEEPNEIEEELPEVIYTPVDPVYLDPSDIEGIQGGHFDLDTATEIFATGSGSTNHHEHAYDNNRNTTSADFFNLGNKKFDDINDTITSQKFILIVANSSLSPGVSIVINGQSIKVTDYQQKVKNFLAGETTALDLYSFNAAPGTTVLSTFRADVEINAIAAGGLVPTQTGCVKRNDAGANGEYRNGALTFQAINIDQAYTIDTSTGVARGSTDLLWEATLFWHWDGACQ
jgi:hypothetical protein